MIGDGREILAALGLEGRYIRELNIRFRAGEIATVVIQEDILHEGEDELSTVLSRYKLTPRDEVAS